MKKRPFMTKQFITFLALLLLSLPSHAQQIPLKMRADALPATKEILDPDDIVMATTVEEMGSWDRYPSYGVYMEMMRQWVESYPNLCHMDTIGESLEGRLILSLYIDAGGEGYRPEFFYSSTIHGDELTGYVMMLRLIDTLLCSYGRDTALTALLNSTRISINPLANPDGTYRGGNSTIMSCQRENSVGVDLNRNFPDPFNPTKSSLQQENQLMIDYFTAHNFRLSANLHGGAEVMNYPWDSFTLEEHPHPAADWWQEVGHRFVDTARAYDITHFRDVRADGVIAGGNYYVIRGGRQDYVNYYHNCLEMTMELSKQKVVPCNRLPHYWRLLSKSLINYIGEIHSLPETSGISQQGSTPLAVYPNPTRDLVTVSGMEEGTLYELTDVTSHRVPMAVVSQENGEVTLNLAPLKPGLYLLRTSKGFSKAIIKY